MQMIRVTATYDSTIKQMLDQLPEEVWLASNTTFLNIAAAGGQIIQCIIERLRSYGHGDDNIKRRVAGVFETEMTRNYAEWKGWKEWSGWGTVIRDHDIMGDHMKKLPIENPDVVIMNPPYHKGLHIKFMDLAMRLTGRYVVSIQPAGWVTTQRPRLIGIRQRGKDVIELIADHARKLLLVNMDKAFDGQVLLYDVGGIFVIDKEYHGSLTMSSLSGQTYECESLASANDYANEPLHQSSERKIVAAVREFGNVAIRNVNERGATHPSAKYFVEICRIRGNVGRRAKDDSKAIDYRQDDFFTWVPCTRKVITSWDNTDRHYIGFNTENEAESFLRFLKTKPARFALKLVKVNSTLDKKCLYMLPNLDWTHEWDEGRIQQIFGFTDEEMCYMDTSLPNYYD